MFKPFRLLFAVAALALSAGAAWAKPPMWVVHDQDSTIILFGSVHILPKGLDWEPDALKAAIAKADDLWFEIPMDDAAILSASELAVEQGLLSQGQSLPAMLTPEGQARLTQTAKSFGMPPDGLNRLKPWLAEATLSVLACRRAGGEAEGGVEREISAAAPSTAQRRAFETLAEQIGFLANSPTAEQTASLEETLKQIQTDPGEYGRLVDAWMAGDLAALDREELEPMKRSSPALYSALITQRNARWTQAILARLRGSGQSVIVVGAGHLIGPDGVPARLRALGVAVDGP